MSDLNAALDTTIAAAVTARVEAEVVAALSGDEVIGQYVAAALREPVEVKDRRTYRTEQVPYLRHVLREAIRSVTKDAISRVLAEEVPLIEEEVRKAVKREAGSIASGIAASLAQRATQGYGINVELKVPGGDA